MVIKNKAGIYSPVSMSAIKQIVSNHKSVHRLLLAYLILSRYAGEKNIGGYDANRVIGAGAEAIKNALNIGWPRANELVKELLRLEVLSRAPSGLMVGASQARYILTMSGDVAIPHSLISGLSKVNGITRLLCEEYAASPDLITTAIVVLMHLYKNHDMLKFGGVSPDMVSEPWKIDIVTPENMGFKVTVSRTNNNANTNLVPTLPFFLEVMRTMGFNQDDRKSRLQMFHEALKLLRISGLTYEAVTLFDSKFTPLFPVRLNDIFAAQSGTEPSFIEDLAAGFYTCGELEKFWIYMPIDPRITGNSFIGISRLRFRCAEQSTAIALERDRLNLCDFKTKLIALDIIDNFD